MQKGIPSKLRNVLKCSCFSILSLLVAGPVAVAGGLEVGISSSSILFQPGRYAEFNGARALPRVDGVLGPISIPNLGGDLTFLSGGIKSNIGKRFDVAFRVREPIQLDVNYPINPALGGLSNLQAELSGVSYQLLGRYRATKAFSVFGGPRFQTATGRFLFGPGETNLQRDGAFGFTAGAAYENRKKRFRSVLTYQSEINHQNATVSDLPGVTTVSQSTPRSIALSVRGPIAPKTIAFGRLQWSHSSKANLSIDNTVTGVVAQSSFRNTINITAGMSRRVTKRLGLSISGSYQNGNGEPAGNIFPTNGRTSVEIGGRFAASKKLSFSAAFSHIWIGDAVAISGAQFEDNSSLLFRSGASIRF